MRGFGSRDEFSMMVMTWKYDLGVPVVGQDSDSFF